MSFTTVIRSRRRAATPILGKPPVQTRPTGGAARPILHLKPAVGA